MYFRSLQNFMQKKVHSSKEFTPLFACSEPSPACYLVPFVYKVTPFFSINNKKFKQSPRKSLIC